MNGRDLAGRVVVVVFAWSILGTLAAWPELQHSPLVAMAIGAGIVVLALVAGGGKKVDRD